MWTAEYSKCTWNGPSGHNNSWNKITSGIERARLALGQRLAIQALARAHPLGTPPLHQPTHICATGVYDIHMTSSTFNVYSQRGNEARARELAANRCSSCVCLASRGVPHSRQGWEKCATRKERCDCCQCACAGCALRSWSRGVWYLGLAGHAQAAAYINRCHFAFP